MTHLIIRRRLFISVTAGLVSGMATIANAQTSAGEPLLEEIVITGTSIRGVQATGTLPITVNEEAIEAIAPRNMADLLATVPQMNQFNLTPSGQATFGGAVASVSLRPNLPAGATLVLINGHRIVPSGMTTGVPDVSILPISAIGRVEVLADGASAVYGSDAVGGVLNFITRRNLNGAETALRDTMGKYSYNSYDISQTFGTSWSSGSVFAAANLNHRDRLPTKGLGFYTNVGTTAGLNGFCAIATFGASSPGCDAAKWGDLQPEEDRLSVFVGAEHDISSAVSLHGEVVYSDVTRKQGAAMTSFPATVMGASNPFNPTPGTATATVFYRPITEFGETLDNKTDMTVMQATVGLNVKLSHDWRIESFGSYGKSENRSVSAGLANAAFQRAMAATTTAGAFDPFAHRTSASVLAQILDATDATNVDQTTTQLSAKADGPLFALPAGGVRLAVGAESRHETEKGQRVVGSANTLLNANTGATGYISQGSADGSRSVWSALSELSVPLIGLAQNVMLVDNLTLSLAARYDDYSDAGKTTNPKVGLDWTLVKGLRLFGNVSRAFQAPPLGSTTSGAVDSRVQIGFNGQPANFAPPTAPYVGTTGLIIAGGSDNLKPQKSHNFSYGVEFQPQAWEGFRATATYWNIDFRDYIALPGQAAFTNPVLAAYGILAPRTGAGGAVVPFSPSSPEVTRFTSVLPVDGSVVPAQIYWISVQQRVNLSRRVLAGVDFDVSQSVSIADGKLTARWAGSLLQKDDLAGAPGSALVKTVDTDSKLRYSVSTDYSKSALRVGAQWNHLGSRYSTIAKVYKINPFDVINFRGGYDFGFMELTFNVDNAFDRKPSFQADAVGGLPVTNNSPQNPYGRLVSLGIKKSW